MTRRRLLAGGAGALAVAAVGGAGGALMGLFGEDRIPMRRSAFDPHVGKGFTLRAPSGHVARARLAAIDDHRHASSGSRDGAFVLTFHARPGAPRLGQDVVTVARSGLGSVNLLMTPSGTGRKGQDYTAVIDTTRS